MNFFAAWKGGPPLIPIKGLGVYLKKTNLLDKAVQIFIHLRAFTYLVDVKLLVQTKSQQSQLLGEKKFLMLVTFVQGCCKNVASSPFISFMRPSNCLCFLFPQR